MRDEYIWVFPHCKDTCLVDQWWITQNKRSSELKADIHTPYQRISLWDVPLKPLSRRFSDTPRRWSISPWSIARPSGWMDGQSSIMKSSTRSLHPSEGQLMKCSWCADLSLIPCLHYAPPPLPPRLTCRDEAPPPWASGGDRFRLGQPQDVRWRTRPDWSGSCGVVIDILGESVRELRWGSSSSSPTSIQHQIMYFIYKYWIHYVGEERSEVWIINKIGIKYIKFTFVHYLQCSWWAKMLFPKQPFKQISGFKYFPKARAYQYAEFIDFTT